MADKEQYFQTIVKIEILGNEPFLGDIADIHHAITDGEFSGAERGQRKITETDVEEMRELLLDQGSDPSFLIHEDDDKDPLELWLIAKAEAAANLNGDDPNDPEVWQAYLADARLEAAELLNGESRG